MKDDNSQTTLEQGRMARMLGLSPHEPERWPMSTINFLLEIEKQEGRVAVLKEIQRMTTPPTKSNNEIIADLVVEKLMTRGIRI